MGRSSSIMQDLAGYLEKEQIDRMLQYAKTPRDHLLIELLFRSGRRISEVLLLKRSDVQIDKELVMYHILKKKRQYLKLKPLDADMFKVLSTYVEVLHPDSYVFPSTYRLGAHLSRRQAYNIIRGCAEAAGIYKVGEKPMHPHILRHSFAVYFLKHAQNKAAALKTLQNILEHASINVTGTYLQFSQEDLQSELNNVFGGK